MSIKPLPQGNGLNNSNESSSSMSILQLNLFVTASCWNLISEFHGLPHWPIFTTEAPHWPEKLTFDRFFAGPFLVQYIDGRAILFVILIRKSNRLRLSRQPIIGLRNYELTNQDSVIISPLADNQKDRSCSNCLDLSQLLECHD